MNFIEALKKIYKPPVGSIWRAPNRIWTSGFAHNQQNNPEGKHPALVEKVKKDKTNVILIPGSSKSYNRGRCVFKTKLVKRTQSYFLINLSMTFDIESLCELNRGWNNVDELNEKQLKDFNLQLKICREF